MVVVKVNTYDFEVLIVIKTGNFDYSRITYNYLLDINRRLSHDKCVHTLILKW